MCTRCGRSLTEPLGRPQVSENRETCGPWFRRGRRPAPSNGHIFWFEINNPGDVAIAQQLQPPADPPAGLPRVEDLVPDNVEPGFLLYTEALTGGMDHYTYIPWWTFPHDPQRKQRYAFFFKFAENERLKGPPAQWSGHGPRTCSPRRAIGNRQGRPHLPPPPQLVAGLHLRNRWQPGWSTGSGFNPRVAQIASVCRTDARRRAQKIGYEPRQNERKPEWYGANLRATESQGAVDNRRTARLYNTVLLVALSHDFTGDTTQ